MKILQNNNQKCIKTLSTNCLKANKGRNKIAVLAIILTAVLFMALTTVLQGAQISIRNQNFRQVGSRFMVSLKNLTWEEAECLVSDPEFAVAGMERYVSNVLNPELNNLNAAVGWADETTAENRFMKLEKGHYPEKENEIACDSEVLQLLGLPYDTGSTFTLQYTAGDTAQEKQMTVCGIWQGMKYEQNTSLLVSESFVESVLEQCDGEFAYMRENSYDVRGSFHDEKNIEAKLENIVKKLGYDPYAERGEEGFLIYHMNPGYDRSQTDSLETLVIAAMGVLLILAAGYLIIYNIFKISVEKDIRLYGQLKTLGTSPRQIRYMVTRQGMLLSVTGIPVGLILGWLLGNALLPPIMANTFVEETTLVVPSVWIWLLSALFTLATVKISCSRPGRIAGKIAPIEAMKYHSAQPSAKIRRNRKRTAKIRKKGNTVTKTGKESRCRILSMAAANLSRNKGKTILVVLSISLSAVLLNSVLNYTGCMDMETYIRRAAVSDFNVQSGAFYQYAAEDYLKVVNRNIADTLQNIDGVTNFGKTYCYMLPDEENPHWDKDVGWITRINQEAVPENAEEFEPSRMLYGFDENALAKTMILEGSIDYEKLCTDNYVIMEGFLNDIGEYDYEEKQFHAGDVIEVEIGGTLREYTVMAIVGAPDSLHMSYSRGGYEYIVFAEPVFLEMFPSMQDPIHCVFDAEEGKFDEINEQVSAIVEQNNLSLSSRLTEEADFEEYRYTYNVVGAAVSLILGLIGALNLINVLLTGVIARQKEFSVMRSIGMTRKQLRKLVIYEGIIYAAFASLIGILLSALLSITMVKELAENTWFMKYHATVIPAVTVSMICILLAAITTAMTDRIWNKGSIVEQLRECE